MPRQFCRHSTRVPLGGPAGAVGLQHDAHEKARTAARRPHQPTRPAAATSRRTSVIFLFMYRPRSHQSFDYKPGAIHSSRTIDVHLRPRRAYAGRIVSPRCDSSAASAANGSASVPNLGPALKHRFHSMYAESPLHGSRCSMNSPHPADIRALWSPMSGERERIAGLVVMLDRSTVDPAQTTATQPSSRTTLRADRRRFTSQSALRHGGTCSAGCSIAWGTNEDQRRAAIIRSWPRE